MIPDRGFSVPRLAALYDDFDSDRCDLDVYAAMADEFGARRVVAIEDLASYAAALDILETHAGDQSFLGTANHLLYVWRRRR